MNEEVNNFKADKFFLWGNRLAIVMLVFSLAYIAFYFRSLPAYIPLFNQLPWGEARLGERLGILFPQGIVGVFMVLNYFFAKYLYTKIPLISRILAITTFLISLMAIIFTHRTIQLIL